MSTILPHSDLNTLHDRLLEEVPRGSFVLDVGAGLAKYHPLLLDRGCRLTLVDAHEPYLAERKARFPSVEVVHSEAWRALWAGISHERIWDVALGIDFIEHLDRSDALAIISMMKRVAPKIVLFIPEGNHPQTSDGYGMGGDFWQTHRSTWVAEDLELLGSTVERWVDFHTWAKDRGADPGALWATWSRQ